MANSLNLSYNREMQNHSEQCLLVTGGAGFIGINFVEIAIQRGHKVIVLDALTYAGHRKNLEGFAGPGELQLVVGYICDFDLTLRLLKEHQSSHSISPKEQYPQKKSVRRYLKPQEMELSPDG